MNEDKCQSPLSLMLESVTYSVVVPVYNSETTLPELVKKIESAMQEIGNRYEIILTDDCSTDNSWKRIIELAGVNKNVKGFRLSNNFGQWMATLAGISRAQGAYVITIDDDLEYDPVDIKKLVAKFTSSDYYLVFGIASEKYKVQGKSTLFSGLRNRVINIIWQKFLTDSFKIFKRELLFANGEKFYPKAHFEAFVNFNLHRRFVGYCEVGYQPRFHGLSNHTLTKKLSLFFKYSLEYHKYPSKGLSVLLAIVLVLSMALENIFFRGHLNGLLLAVMSLIQVCILLLIVQYVAPLFLEAKNIPIYWIIEKTPE